MNTTINGRIVRVFERHAVTAGDERMEHLIIEGHHEKWPIHTDVTVSFPEERFHGRITALIASETNTELRILRFVTKRLGL